MPAKDPQIPRTPGAPAAPERRPGERSETGLRGGAAGAPPDPNHPSTSPADTEVDARPTRRRFTAEYKLAIVREADAAQGSGGVGAILRREGLYASHLITWRRQRAAGELTGLTPRRRGPQPKPVNTHARECEKLRREVARLAAKLAQAHAIIDIQKKVAAMLGTPIKDDESDEGNS